MKVTKNSVMYCLDLGCGDKPKGSVNVDLFFKESPHRRGHSCMNSKLVPNPVKADVNHLPFRDKAFWGSTCFWVLEHRGVDFVKTLREMVRVSINKITFEVPHRYSLIKSPNHDKSFSCVALISFLKKMGFLPNLEVKYRYIPKFLGLIRVPHLIYVEIMLR